MSSSALKGGRVESSGLCYSAQQLEAIKQAVAGENVLIVGYLGTGKTATLDEIEKQLEAKGKKVVRTAYIELAAKRIKESHFHEVLGFETTEEVKQTIKLFKDTPAECARARIGRNPEVIKDLKSYDVLIEDDGSNTHDWLFEFSDWMFRLAKGCEDKRFGGVQRVTAADYWSFSPLRGIPLCGTTPMKAVFLIVVELTKSYRHNDEDFERVKRAAHGELTSEDRKWLSSRVDGKIPADFIVSPMFSRSHNEPGRTEKKDFEAAVERCGGVIDKASIRKNMWHTQGESFEAVYADLSRVWASYMPYNVLGRLKNHENLTLASASAMWKDYKPAPNVVKFYAELRASRAAAAASSPFSSSSSQGAAAGSTFVPPSDTGRDRFSTPERVAVVKQEAPSSGSVGVSSPVGSKRSASQAGIFTPPSIGRDRGSGGMPFSAATLTSSQAGALPLFSAPGGSYKDDAEEDDDA
jgi:AAA domain